MTPEVCEVVVISGPRKGEIATIAAEVLPANSKNGRHSDGEMALTPEEEAEAEALMKLAIEAADRTIESARAAGESMEAATRKLEEVNQRYDGLFRTNQFVSDTAGNS